MKNTVALPPIRLADLPQQTKDFLFAVCAGSNVTLEEAAKRVLNAAAKRTEPLSSAAEGILACSLRKNHPV